MCKKLASGRVALCIEAAGGLLMLAAREHPDGLRIAGAKTQGVNLDNMKPSDQVLIAERTGEDTIVRIATEDEFEELRVIIGKEMEQVVKKWEAQIGHVPEPVEAKH